MGGKAPGTLGVARAAQAARSVHGASIVPGTVGVSAATASGPRLLLQGVAAMRAAGLILSTAHPYVYRGTVLGDVLLQPGTTWSGHRMLLDAGPMVVHYTVSDQLFEWRTSDFIRVEWLTAMSRGARSARWLVKIAKLEFQFLLGLFVPVYGMVLITCAELFEMYEKNPGEFRTLHGRLPPAYRKLKELRRMFPRTFGVLMRLARESLVEHFAEGISGEDVAFWLGRLIRGFRALPEVTLRGLVWVVSFTTIAVGVIHAPKIAVGAGGPAAEEFVKKLEALLKEKGDTMSREDALAVLKELTDKKDALALLQGLKEDMEAIVPAVQAIAKSHED